MTNNNPQVFSECENTTVIETEDQPEHPKEASAIMSLWPTMPQLSEPEPQAWRGVFSPIYKWEILFSQHVKIRTSELPRLKPHITVDRRMLEGEDD
ncbi:hypothetical protein L0337_23685 [candidate division KSB1 bacterium]|nr:hypothetical protein [candidate division KSB1 bacterium]